MTLLRLGFAISLTLSAGIIAWLGGRRKRQFLGDPMFTERFFAHRMTMVRIYAVLAVAITALAPEASALLVPLMLLAVAIGGFSARRDVFGENWTLAQYLGNRARLIFFGGLPWAALLGAPAIVASAGLGSAPFVFAAVVVLYWFQHRFLSLGLAAEPLRDETLLSLLEPVMANANAPRPMIVAGGAPEGRFLNAFAMPAGRKSRVLMTRALLRALAPEEAHAIFAHEMAHLEEFWQTSMRIRIGAGRIVLPLLAVLPQVFVLRVNPSQAFWVSAIWPLLFFVAIVIALAMRQQNETAADLRALQLGADPHALISGLEKIHEHNGMPRRLDAAREKQMTHPTLARRIAAIRRASGLETAPATIDRRTFAARKGGFFLTFTDDALQVFDRAPEETSVPSRVFAYGELQSLVLRQTLSGWELLGRHGRARVRFSISPADVAEVQRALDAVDTRFAAPAHAVTHVALRTRLIAFVVLLVSLFPGISFPPMVVAILTMITASATALAALGATALAAGLLAFNRPPMPFLQEIVAPMGAAEALFGVMCLLMVMRVPKEQRHRGLRATIITLSVFVIIASIPLAVGVTFDQPLLQFFLAARSRPSLVILFFGIAAALTVAGRRRLAIAHAAIASMVLFAGTQLFATLIGGDPLLTQRSAKWIAAPKPIAEHRVSGHPFAVLMSNDSRVFAVRWTEEYDEQPRFGVFAKGKSPVEVAAADIAFLDSQRILKLTQSEKMLAVEMIDVAGQPLGWRVELPPVYGAQLIAREDGTWIVAGRTLPRYRYTRYRGVIGETSYETEAIAADQAAMISAPASNARELVYARMPLAERGRLGPWLMMLSQSGGGSEFWRASNSSSQPIGRTVFGGGTAIELPDSGRWALVAHDERSTYVATFDSSARSIRAAGSLGERAFAFKGGRGSRIATHGAQSAYVWNLATNKAMRIEMTECVVMDVALSDDAAAVLAGCGYDTVVRLYPTASLR